MIRRNYFYQVNIQNKNSKFLWGIYTVKTWFPKPWIATKAIIKSAKDTVNAADNEIKIITFNRV